MSAAATSWVGDLLMKATRPSTTLVTLAALQCLGLIACSGATPGATPEATPTSSHPDTGTAVDTGFEGGTDAGVLDLPAPLFCYVIDENTRAPVRDATPVEPFEIMDGVYYVGNSQVSSHLIKTTQGLMLIDTTMPHQMGWLLTSIRKLGFEPSDVKVVIGSHYGIDHVGGHQYFQRYLGAQTWLGEADVAAARAALCVDGYSGGVDAPNFPPFETDRGLRDGEVIDWGGRQLKVYSTPVSSPGAVTLEFELLDEAGQPHRAGILGGVAARGAKSSYEDKLRALKERNIEVFLAVHPDQNDTLDKAARLQQGTRPNPFIDPVGWNALIDKILKF